MIDASPQRLAAVWDRATRLPPAERASVLLELAGEGGDDLDACTLGRCDVILASIFRALFGDAIEATVGCDACAALLEFETTVRTLFGSNDGDVRESGPFCVSESGYEITLRPIRLRDIAALPASRSRARDGLLERCVLEARYCGNTVDAGLLPPAVTHTISRALGDADPLAEVVITLACTECGRANGITFDIATFLWEAIDRTVARSLANVHVLATAYGWSERDILALPAARIRRYLELCADE